MTIIEFDKAGNASYMCSQIGLQGTTNVYIRKSPTGREDWPFKYTARMGIAIFGYALQFDKSPFDDDWHDNFVEGVHCGSAEQAIEKMKQAMESLHESLWD